MIYPQDQTLATDPHSSLATALINFMGAITADQFSDADGQGDAAGTNYKRYVITSVAGMVLRIEFNFGTGSAQCHLFGTYGWEKQEGDPPTTTQQSGDIPIIGASRAFFVQNNP